MKNLLTPLAITLTLACSIMGAQAACTGLTTFTSGTTANASAVNNNFSTLAGCTTIAVPTQQVKTTAGSGTYTTPANARQLRIRMIGGGGGGGGSGVGPGTATAGSDTIFNSVHAAGGGAAALGGNAGSGGTGGTGSANVRIAGAPGGVPTISIWTATNFVSFGGAGGGPGGGAGAGTGGSANAGNSGVANTGGGGSGASNGSATQTAMVSNVIPPGGGAGEYVELIINSPTSSYTYTVGSGGNGASAGTGGAAGGNGGSGVIIVDEYY